MRNVATVRRTTMAPVKLKRDWSIVEEAMEQAAVPCTGGGTSISEAEPRASRPNFVFPGAVLLVGSGGEIVYERAFGCRSLVSDDKQLPDRTPLTADMVFDVASLTKVMVTTLIAMQLEDEGRLHVDRRLSHIFQTFGTHGKEQMTLRHLLSHRSGYPATVPYYRDLMRADQGARSGVMNSRAATEFVYNAIFRGKLDNMPGKVGRYSDVGFILLGHALETISGTPLDKLAIQKVIEPLQLRSTGYIDLGATKRHVLQPVTEIIVPTARCPWRNKILCGEVHDDNAWAMGGIAAHAGIFSTAADIHRFAYEMIRCYHGQGDIVSQEMVKKFWTIDGGDAQSTWALGWDTPSKQGSSSGHYFSESAVGHLGYTGCSLWIDPKRELDVILLSNRIHPSVDNNAIRQFRPLLHDAVMQALGYAG